MRTNNLQLVASYSALTWRQVFDAATIHLCLIDQDRPLISRALGMMALTDFPAHPAAAAAHA
jgi:hypothetical protein